LKNNTSISEVLAILLPQKPFHHFANCNNKKDETAGEQTGYSLHRKGIQK